MMRWIINKQAEASTQWIIPFQRKNKPNEDYRISIQKGLLRLMAFTQTDWIRRLIFLSKSM